MRIAVLGPLEVQTDDLAPVTVSGAKERLLLAALVAGAPGVVSTDALAETLWDGDPPVSARKSLQAHVVRLRTSLEPDRPSGSTGRFVARRGRGYALILDRGSIDALAISDIAARGRARLAAGDVEEAEQLFASAVGLWRGDPYADWPDAAFCEAERRRLAEVRAGAAVGLLEARLQLGRHADVLPDLERLVTEEPLREEWWRLLVLALYRAGRQGDALAAARRARAVLADELGAAPGPALRAAEAAVLAQDPSLDPVARPAPPPIEAGPAPGSCPFKGLAVYQVDDAPLFHGRERLVAGLAARLVDAGLLVVSGPSGAGKSSAVRAGLVSALARGALPGSQSWRAVVVTPRRAPVDVLAPLTGDPPPSDPVLLVCDQFEELWAPAVDPAERTAFLDAVLGLVEDEIVVRCVVVVRGDYVGRLAEHPAFTEQPGAAFALVPPLTEPELRDIVREPARIVGLRVDGELVDAVVADVRDQAGALPLLSMALVGTWERRRGDALTLAGYLEAGGVEGALTRSAEAAFAALDETGHDLARRLFVRLADTDDGGALVRRAFPLGDLDLTGEHGAARRDVVETFVNRRLLAVDDDRLEVAHEALLTAWPRLVRWLEDDAAGRAVRRHLALAVREWQASGRPDDELYRGARLTAALDWAESADTDVTVAERRFLDASRERADAELLAARQRADREATARHRTRRLAIGLSAVLAVALVATFLAVRAQRQAQDASVVADANRLAALSTTAGSLDLALLLAAQAVRLADTPETQDGLLTALTGAGRAERAVPWTGALVFDALLADGGRSLTFGNGSEVISWEVGPMTQAEVGYLIPDWGGWLVAAPSPTEDEVMGAGTRQGVPWLRMISPDGTTRLLQEGDEVGGLPISGTVSSDGTRVHLLVATPDRSAPESRSSWRITDVDVVDGTRRDTGVGGTFPAPVDALAADFSNDGGSAVLRDAAGVAAPVLIHLSDRSLAPVTVEPRAAELLEILALDDGAAQLWDDGEVVLVDGTGAPLQQLGTHQEPVRDIEVSPDGTWAVTVGDGRLVILWDVDPETSRWSQREVLAGHDGDVLEAEVDPGGGRLITVSLDHTIIRWDVTADGGLGESFPGLTGRWIANRPRVIEPGELVVAPTRPGNSVTEDRETRPGPDTVSVAATFFDPATGAVVAEVPVGDTIPTVSFGSSVAVSPDRSRVAVTWGLGTTVLDTRTREVIQEIVLPPNGGPGLEGEPYPATVVWSAAWTSDGSTLLLGAEWDVVDGVGGYLVPVDTTTWDLGEPIDIGSAQTIELSPDRQKLLAALLGDAGIVVLDAATLEVERRLPLPEGEVVTAMAFSPDGRRVAAVGLHGLLRIFDTTTWDLVREPATVQNADLLQVEWLPDNRTVVTSGTNGTVSLFDVERGLVRARPLRASPDPGEGYAHLLPGQDDELVVLSGERTGYRYPMDTAAWLDAACAIAARDLTRAEWDRYLPGRDFEPTCTDLP